MNLRKIPGFNRVVERAEANRAEMEKLRAQVEATNEFGMKALEENDRLLDEKEDLLATLKEIRAMVDKALRKL